MNTPPEPPPPPPSPLCVVAVYALAIFGPWVALWRIAVHFNLWPR